MGVASTGTGASGFFSFLLGFIFIQVYQRFKFLLKGIKAPGFIFLQFTLDGPNQIINYAKFGHFPCLHNF